MRYMMRLRSVLARVSTFSLSIHAKRNAFIFSNQTIFPKEVVTAFYALHDSAKADPRLYSVALKRVAKQPKKLVRCYNHSEMEDEARKCFIDSL